MIIVFWIVALALGGLHPFGFVAALIELVVFSWFFVAVGTFFSLRARTTTRALVSTVVALSCAYGGYLLLMIPLGLPVKSPFVATLAIPFLWNWSLVSFDNVWGVDRTIIANDYFNNYGYDIINIFSSNSILYATDYHFEVVFACALGVLLFAGAAISLTICCVRRFDALVDRPRRSWPNARVRESKRGG